jgi:hypothetical protein
MSPWTFSPLSSSSEPLLLLCLLCSASSCRQCSSPGCRRAGPRRPPPTSPSSTRHPHLEPGSGSLPVVLICARHGCRSSARPPPHRRRGEPTAEPQTSISRAHQHYTSLYIPFLRFPCQFSNTRPKPHCRSSSPPPATLGIAVGSRHQAPLAPINPRASFPIPCSCSSTPCCPPIAAEAPSPTSATVAAFGLTVGSSLRAFLRHHDSLTGTTSMLCNSMTSSWGL